MKPMCIQYSKRTSKAAILGILLVLFQEVSCQEINCSHQLYVQEEQAEGGGPLSCQRKAESEWQCTGLQPALEMAGQMNTSACASIFFHPGHHVISAPVHLGSKSVQFTGLLGDRPSSLVLIHCAYDVEVDTERLFDQSYTYTDYSLYFNRSNFVSFSGLNFVYCPYPFRLDTVETVRIINSTFQHFTEAVFDIYNSPDVAVTGSTFYNNSGTGISRTPLRGNTGAVALTFDNIDPEEDNPQAIIANCNFTKNRATSASFIRDTDSVAGTQLFPGRGGGLGIFTYEFFHNVTVMVHDNVFSNNYAHSFGGGIFMTNLGGDETKHVFLVERNTFEGNLAWNGGGGIIVSFFSIGEVVTSHTAIIANCSFAGNSGESGGGLLTYIASRNEKIIFVLEKCNFTGNHGVGTINDYGSAYGVWWVGSRNGREAPRYNIIDCIFSDNFGSSGIVSIGYAPFSFYGRNVFFRNKGTSALRIVGSLVDIYGTLDFLENEAGTATALELLSFAQIRLRKGLQMNFSRNKGRLGASISSGASFSSDIFNQVAFNPQCFMLYENSQLPPSEWTNVSIKFQENEAVLASSLYASTFSDCSWFSLSYPYFDLHSIFQWPLIEFGNDSKNTGYPNRFALEYHVGTIAKAVQVHSKRVVAWPGKIFNLSLAGWDEFNNPTAVSIRVNFFGKEDFSVRFFPEIVVIGAETKSTLSISEFPVTYAISDSKSLSNDKFLGDVRVNVLSESSQLAEESFELYSDLCPAGYELVPLFGTLMECRCIQEVAEILNCEVDQDSVTIQNGYWVSAVPSNKTHNQILHFYTCPAGYCRCVQNSSLGESNCVFMYTNSNPNAQCSCNRHGILCGECGKGYGVSVLLNRCVNCTTSYIFLLPLLVLVEVVLFVALLLSSKQTPIYLYAFTFYIQVVSYCGLYFFEGLSTAGHYLYFFSSALSFYFPYDFCLYENLSPIVSYFIRLLPLVVLLLVVPLVIVLKCKWKRTKLEFHGLCIIVHLLYIHVIHTCMSILNCPMIVERSGSVSMRWFANGGQVCFTGWHVPLGLLSIVILTLAVVAIPLSALITLEKLSKFRWINGFRVPLTQGFRENFKWWAAIELTRRFVFILAITLFPREQVYVLLLLCIFFVLYTYSQPYKSPVANILEAVLQLNFLVLLLLVWSNVLQPLHQQPNTNMSVIVDTCPFKQKGVVAATWILVPVYYFPCLLLAISCGAYAVSFCKRMFTRPGLGMVNEDYEMHDYSLMPQQLSPHGVTFSHLENFGDPETRGTSGSR